jgi:hypothetical protein
MTEQHQGHGADEHGAIHHEESDANFAGIIGFGAGLVAVCAVVAVVVYGVFRYLEKQNARQGPVEYPLAITEGNRQPPEPRLQTNPREDLHDMRVKEDEVLHSYGWVDRNGGIVRIPIDDAITLTLERGLPSRQVKP